MRLFAGGGGARDPREVAHLTLRIVQTAEPHTDTRTVSLSTKRGGERDTAKDVVERVHRGRTSLQERPHWGRDRKRDNFRRRGGKPRRKLDLKWG